jgi:hypothetical protein
LPSSLTRVISSALGCSPRPPVSVCSTVTKMIRYEAFLGSVGSTTLRGKAPRIRFSALNGKADLPTLPAYQLKPGRPSPGWPTLLRPPFAQTPPWWYRNIDRFPITYASRPRLRGRLTLRRLPLLRKPQAFGERVFHPLSRYLCQHNLFRLVQVSSRSPFDLTRNAPLPSSSLR